MTKKKETTKKEDVFVIEEYKGLPIYFDKKYGMFYVILEDEEFSDRAIYVVKEHIDNSKCKNLDGFAFYKGAMWQLHKVKLLYRTRSAEVHLQDVCDNKDVCCDVGSIRDRELKDIIPDNKNNRDIFEKVKLLILKKNIIYDEIERVKKGLKK